MVHGTMFLSLFSIQIPAFLNTDFVPALPAVTAEYDQAIGAADSETIMS